MKFSNGCWLNRDGVETFSPQEVYSTKIEDDELTVYAPCNRINHRGDTLQGPVMTYKVTSPIEDVIRVRVYHYMGGKNKTPSFDINEDESFKCLINEDENNVSLKAGNLRVQFNKDSWNVSFYKGNTKLTESIGRGLAYVVEDKKNVFMREQLELQVGELVYGLGERFTPFVKNGQTVDIWNKDGGTSTEQSYKNIPFYITNKGYGVFVNHPDKVSFEVASERVSKVQFSVPGEYIDYFIIGGNSMKEVIKNYTKLTGKPALPPAWSFGLWLTTSFTTNYDEKTVTSFVDGMAERDIPLRVFHFDCFWMKEFNWCNFEWDKRVFPDPKGMLKRLKAKGLNLCVWINPYIGQESKLFNEGKEKGYFIKKANGDVWQWDMWQPSMAIVDFTNPNACAWYAGKLKDLLNMGVDCFKTDFGERIPTEDVVYYDGSDPQRMHNYYTMLYNKLVFETIKEVRGEEQAVLFARSATAGGQQFPVHWGGDCESTYQAMSESLRGGLSLCMSGFGFWSHDIGGFESTSTADVYKRWVAFGLLSSHSRLHGSSSYRVPWLYDEEAVDVVRFFSKLKCSLMPYLYEMAIKAHEDGTAVMRSMVLEFEEDKTCQYLDKQYMLGNSILVAPIFNEKGIVEYYLPAGKWTNYITGKTYEGGKWIKEHHDYLSIPMLIKENSLIAIGSENRKPDYDFRKEVSILAFNLKDNEKTDTRVFDMNSEEVLKVEAILSGSELTIISTGTEGKWNFVLKDITDVNSVIGGKAVKEGKDTRIIIDSGSSKVICKIG